MDSCNDVELRTLKYYNSVIYIVKLFFMIKRFYIPTV